MTNGMIKKYAECGGVTVVAVSPDPDVTGAEPTVEIKLTAEQGLMTKAEWESLTGAVKTLLEEATPK